MNALHSVVEMPSFQKFAEQHLRGEERTLVIDYIAARPLEGDLLQATGGLRKLRFAAKGKGKSGGVRVIYYYHDLTMPILLISGFAKNEKDTLSMSDCNAMKKMLPIIIAGCKRGYHV